MVMDTDSHASEACYCCLKPYAAQTVLWLLLILQAMHIDIKGKPFTLSGTTFPGLLAQLDVIASLVGAWPNFLHSLETKQ